MAFLLEGEAVVGFVIECGQIDDFYVEYKILGDHYIDVRGFKNPDLLLPYLSQIDVRDLEGK